MSPAELTTLTDRPYGDDEADLVAYGVVRTTDDNPAWVRVGSARKNRDGSINLRLHAVPMSSEVHLRPAQRAPWRSRSEAVPASSGESPAKSHLDA